MFLKQKRFLFYFILGAIFFVPIFTQAAYPGEIRDFYLEQEYDADHRLNSETSLQIITNKIYFYIDKQWWSSLNSGERAQVNQNLYYLASEFENKIYPVLTKVFGSEDNPGIDNDSHVLVILHPMKEDIQGYIRSQDGFSQNDYSNSNEGEIIYLNADNFLASSLSRLKYFLAHEFMHTISLNQKEKIFGISQETWLNEARAQYIGTLLGYNNGDNQEGDLKTRMKDFFSFPNDPLTIWNNTKYDYASTDLFIHYLVDHYSLDILVDSLQSEKVGIDSINYALEKNSFEENFSDIFTDWLIANIVNNCSFGEKYCYKHPSLKNFRIFPYGYYLPTKGNSFLEVINSTYAWTGNWQKIVGGKDVLKVEFSTFNDVDFRIPYIIIDTSGGKTIKFLHLNSEKKGIIYVPDFGKTKEAIIIMPFVAGKLQDSEIHSFNWKISTVSEVPQDYNSSNVDEEKIQELLEMIEILKQKIAILVKQLAEIESGSALYCPTFNRDLYFGMRDNSNVKCLQQFLKSKGSEIYPEGLVTGYFGPLTKLAVQRYQQSQGIITTGYFGPLTRTAANTKL